MNKDNLIWLLLGISLILYFVYEQFYKVEPSQSKYPNLQKVKNRFNLLIQSIIFEYAVKVNHNMVLAVIVNESNLLFETFSNAEVKGDNNSSYGFMQVSKWAVAEVNNYYQTNFSLQDTLDETKNLTVGILFLNIMYESALKSSSSNPVKLAFKKYNGGIDESDLSYNVLADKYADKAYVNYLKFLEL